MRTRSQNSCSCRPGLAEDAIQPVLPSSRKREYSRLVFTYNKTISIPFSDTLALVFLKIIFFTIFNEFSFFLCGCKKNQEMLHNLFSVNSLSRPNSIQHSVHFLFRVFNSRHDVYTQLAENVTWWEPLYFFILNYHISVSIRKSAKRGHCTNAEQECCIMTD